MSISIDDAEVAIAIAFLVMLFFVCVTMRTFVCWLRFYFVVEVGGRELLALMTKRDCIISRIDKTDLDQ